MSTPSPELVPIVWVTLNTSLGKPKPIRLKALCDSGASSTIIKHTAVSNLRIRHDKSTTWNTAAGHMTTTGRCKIQFILPEFHSDRVISWDAHVHESTVTQKYDMIIGRDLLNALNMDIRFSDQTITWEDGMIPMKPTECTSDDSFFIKDEMEDDLGRILNAKYEKADLETVVNDYDHLQVQDKEKLLCLLRDYESLFDGTLGTWKGTAYDIELRPDAKPYHARAYNLPKSVKKNNEN